MAAVKTVWVNFLSETSVHGCNKTVGNQNHIIKRLIWLFFLCAMLATFGYTTISLYLEYHEYNYITKTSVDFPEKMEIPAITLCNVHSFNKYKFDASQADIGEYLSHQFKHKEFNASSHPKWKNISLTIDDLEKLSFQTKEVVGYAFIFYPGDVSSEFKVNYVDRLTSCYTINDRWNDPTYPDDMLKGDEMFNFNIYMNVNQGLYAFESVTSGIRMYIHPPNEPVDMKSPSTMLSPGSSFEIKLSIKYFNYLPHPYNSYQGGTCLHRGSTPRLKHAEHYTYRACMKECLSDAILSTCGCAVEYIYFNATYNRTCTIFERETCAKDIYYSYRYNHYPCNCTTTCSEVKYVYEISSGIYPSESYIAELVKLGVPDNITWARNNLLHAKIGFRDSMTLTTSHVEEMTFTDIVGQLGGYMGFCLGASLLSVLELTEAVFRCLKTLFSPSKVNSVTSIGKN